MAAEPTKRALDQARAAERLMELDPLPVRDILHLLIRAVITLAHAVARLDDAQKRKG